MTRLIRISIALGLAIFLWSVISSAPASIAGKFVRESGVYAQAYTGTLWEGRALGLSVNFGGQGVYLDTLEWDLSPFSLLLFSPTADIDAEGSGLRIKGQVGLLGDNHWRLEDGDISFPAGLLGASSVGSFAGTMTFQLNQLEVDKRAVNALDGRAVWQSASWFMDRRWWPLGNFSADLSSVSGDVIAMIFDQGGAIGLNGKVAVKPSGSYDFSGDIKPREGAPEELKTALAVIGERQPDDSYRVSFQGEF